MKWADQWQLAVSAESHEGKNAQKGSHQEDMDYRVRSHFT